MLLAADGDGNLVGSIKLSIHCEASSLTGGVFDGADESLSDFTSEGAPLSILGEAVEELLLEGMAAGKASASARLISAAALESPSLPDGLLFNPNTPKAMAAATKGKKDSVTHSLRLRRSSAAGLPRRSDLGMVMVCR